MKENHFLWKDIWKNTLSSLRYNAHPELCTEYIKTLFSCQKYTWLQPSPEGLQKFFSYLAQNTSVKELVLPIPDDYELSENFFHLLEAALLRNTDIDRFYFSTSDKSQQEQVLKILEKIPRIKHLIFDSPFDWDSFATCLNKMVLTSLKINSSTGFPTTFFTSLRPLPSLKVLKIAGGKLSHDEVEHMMKHVTEKYINLEEFAFQGIIASILPFLPYINHSALKRLIIHECFYFYLFFYLF